MGLPIALRAGEPKLAVMSACLTCGVCRLAGYVILCFLTAVNNNFTCLCRLTKHETCHSCTCEQDSQEAWT